MDIDDWSHERWVREVHRSLENVNTTGEHCASYICRVPDYIKDFNNKAYEPQVVSIGPFHYFDDNLMPMREHKHRAVVQFLRRAKRPLEDFVTAIQDVVEELQNSYKNLNGYWIRHKDMFGRLMIMDGCFMLEFMSKGMGMDFVNSETTPSITSLGNDYPRNDPIFSPRGILYAGPYIKRDMLLLENQLPFLVLKTLVATATNTNVEFTENFLHRMVVRTLDPRAQFPALPEDIRSGFHVLDVYRKHLLYGSYHPSSRRPDGPYVIRVSRGAIVRSAIVRSAMWLYEAGIQFQPSRTTSLRDIEFHDGILTIPTIVVDDTTEYMLLNLMAFERLHLDTGHEITSYVRFLDNIIHSAKDVSLLSSKGIIFNKLGTDEEVARILRNIPKDIVLPEPTISLIAVQESVNRYCSRPWNNWRANLSHNLSQKYFRSPWAILTLLAAIFFLSMMVMQTVYTALQYYENNSPK